MRCKISVNISWIFDNDLLDNILDKLIAEPTKCICKYADVMHLIIEKPQNDIALKKFNEYNK